jgi:hypothetical protein
MLANESTFLLMALSITILKLRRKSERLEKQLDSHYNNIYLNNGNEISMKN